ncbi:MAG: cobalt ABC transporter permease, partial [Campylobacter hyointestinalis]
TYAILVAMLFLSEFKKSKILDKTMQARGFIGKFYKFEDKIRLGFYDILLMILVLISIIFKQGIII